MTRPPNLDNSRRVAGIAHPPSLEQCHRAALTVAHHARDTAERAEFLAMLGLDQDTDEQTGAA